MRDRTTPRDVARPAVTDAEIATVRATEVADADARRCRVRGRVSVDDTQHQPDKPNGAVAAPAAVRSTSQHRIPGEEVLARRRRSRPIAWCGSASDGAGWMGPATVALR